MLTFHGALGCDAKHTQVSVCILFTVRTLQLLELLNREPDVILDPPLCIELGTSACYLKRSADGFKTGSGVVM